MPKIRNPELRRLNKLIAGAVSLVFLIAAYSCSKQSEVAQEPKEGMLITRVVDGDTLVLEGGERVRLIGIDTPEMHDSDKLLRDARRTNQDTETIKSLGRQSYAFTKSIAEGKRCRLEYDVEKKDRYKRTLAYAYLSDGTFLNAEIVKQGYASLLTIPPNVKYADLFLSLYREARENKRGLWQ